MSRHILVSLANKLYEERVALSSQEHERKINSIKQQTDTEYKTYNSLRSVSTVLGKRNRLGQILPAQQSNETSLPHWTLKSLDPDEPPHVRIPTVIRCLPTIHQNLSIPEGPETFKSDFLHRHLCGDRVSQTLYWSEWEEKRSPYRGKSYAGRDNGCLVDAYHIVKSQHEPFMPVAPGHHGAKLSPFVYEHDYNDVPRDNVPLFMADSNGDCVYYGQYRQPRKPDLLDYDRLVEEVPISVKRYWAHKLGTLGHHGESTEWLRENIISYRYETHYPRFKKEQEDQFDIRAQSPRREPDDAEYELEYCQDLDKIITDMDEDKIMEFYRDPDSSGDIYRLAWEYFECTGYDHAFHDELVRQKRKDSEM